VGKKVLSAVILTKNEEKNIKRCLNSVSFADEVIVVDDFSNDNTGKIAEEYKAAVYKRNLNTDFSAQRNFGISKARGDWILFIDADEEVSKGLQDEIIKLLNYDKIDKEEINAYYIKRRDRWWGRELKFGEVEKTRTKGLVRLVKKNSGKWVNPVHEVLEASGPVSQLDNYLNHYPHQTVKEFLEEVNFYSTIRAKELSAKGKRTNIGEIIFYPFFKFVLNYFIYLGFLDGAAGFAYAFFMSFHSFLVRTKLFQYAQLNSDSS
jgi:glycosyltransferase involved in cell wall biosynthesis